MPAHFLVLLYRVSQKELEHNYTRVPIDGGTLAEDIRE